MNLVTSLSTSRPPSSLSPFRVTRLPGKENEASYRIACRCGSETGRIVSEFDPAEQFWADPIVFECTACGSSELLFDSRRHGYDAILNQFSAYEPRTKDEIVRCASCGSDRHLVTASFTYNFEDDEVHEEWSADDRADMPDLFDSAGFELTCGQCGQDQWLTGFECA